MATDYKIVVVPDTGGTRPCIECPQCLGLQLLFVHVVTEDTITCTCCNGSIQSLVHVVTENTVTCIRVCLVLFRYNYAELILCA